MQVWTDTELEFLRDNLREKTAEIYGLYQEEFGSGHRTYDSIQKKVKKLREAFEADDEAVIDSEEELEQKIQNMLSSNSQLFVSSVSPSAKAVITTRSKEWLEGLINYSEKVKFPTPLPPVQSHNSTLCVLLSDVHVGQHNKWYDLEAARHRIADVPIVTHSYTKGYKIDEVLILMAGDMVEGEDIYPTQSSHIMCACIDQVTECTEALWAMILHFYKLFKCRVRVIAVPGNHGRTGKNVSERTNWDNIVYHSLRLLMREHGSDQLSIECDFNEFKTFIVKDKKGLLYHEGVRHSGTPAMREKIAGWLTGWQCDFMAHGHFHEWKIGDWNGMLVVSNGSMCGTNDLGQRMAKVGTPARQGYWLVTPGKPIHSIGFVEWKEQREDAVSPSTEEHKP